MTNIVKYTTMYMHICNIQCSTGAATMMKGTHNYKSISTCTHTSTLDGSQFKVHDLVQVNSRLVENNLYAPHNCSS